MSKESKVFQIFVASPSDVEDERAILSTVVAELNRTWSNSLGLTLELLKWETHVHPSFASDPQAVINEQIAVDYDAFIGIFWSRIGTPTPRAESGSIEEFERAYSKWKINDKSPEIMIYFKDEAIPPSKIDSIQLAAVQSFKNTIGSIGGIYSQFEDKASFESSVRAHLSVVAQNFADKKQLFVPAHKYSQQLTLTKNADSFDEIYSYSDFLEVYTTRTEETISAYKSFSTATSNFSQSIVSKHTELMENWNDLIFKKRMDLRFIDYFNIYAENIQENILKASRSRKIALNAFSKMLSFPVDAKGNKLNYENYKKLTNLILNSSNNLKIAIQKMKKTTNDFQEDNSNILDARRDVLTQLDSFLLEIENSNSNYKNILEALDKFNAVKG